ncbi:hypothetical protein EKN06_07745 [Croceicoccus ponticola]|uniref:Uncharacterized protein n=1 Tax=Croceicoccus ponticola TaxID=2217664 RepID=A0A437GYR5_9SPHN|nr:hypothetical protein [Croceicoccus ponticola]RVQ67799.1 hypothetical protein EKN06_07745 [Croceicoccus ponticola]
MINRPSHIALALAFTLCACNGGGDPAPEPTASDRAVAIDEDAALPALPIDAAEQDETGFPASFRALGTEPFWAVHVSEGRLRYMTPEDQQGQSLEYTREQTGKDEIALTAKLDDQDMVLTGRVAECSDGMSDREYPYTITLTIGEEVRKGCARPIEP